MVGKKTLILICLAFFISIGSYRDDKIFIDYEVKEYSFKGHEARIVFPNKKNSNNYWIWRARFWGHEPQLDKAQRLAFRVTPEKQIACALRRHALGRLLALVPGAARSAQVHLAAHAVALLPGAEGARSVGAWPAPLALAEKLSQEDPPIIRTAGRSIPSVSM